MDKSGIGIMTYVRRRTGAWFPSPSKIFLIRKIKAVYDCGRHQTIIDCASANFKHRYLFKNSDYLGIDIDESAILKGKKLWPESSRSNGLHYDLRGIRGINLKADLVVSTNTLDHLDRHANVLHLAIGKLTEMTDFNGDLIFNVRNFPTEMQPFLESLFERVTYQGFMSPTSVRFENFWGPRVGGAWLPAQLLIAWPISWVASYLDRFTDRPLQTLIKCEGRRGSNAFSTTAAHQPPEIPN